MTSQMEADLALAEHRAVMAALLRSCIQRPTDEQYEQQLNLFREEMGRCVIFTSDLPSHVSGAL
jgi:hypothetical protein